MSNFINFQKPKLPSPKIPDQYQRLTAPHFSTPNGMLLPQKQQPPPMFGLRGSTIPPKYLNKHPPDFKKLVIEHPYVREIEEKQEPKIFCDFCDRYFRCNDQLEKHKLQNHKELMGIQKRVYTEEEINEWKEARKKRYPTTSNVLARQQAQEERRKRGERLEKSNSRFGSKKDRRHPLDTATKSYHKLESKKNNNNNKNNSFKNFSNFKEIPEKIIDDSNILNGLCKFQGTSGLCNYERTRIIKQTSALTCLGEYGSESDSEIEESQEENKSLIVDDPPDEIPILKVDLLTDSEIASTLKHRSPPKDDEANLRKRQRKRKHSKNELTSSNGVEDQSSQVNANVTSQEVIKPKETFASKTPLPKVPWYRRYPRHQNTMLEKLLETEIRHERNVLLQCVRYVVQNKFFGIGSENQSVSESIQESKITASVD